MISLRNLSVKNKLIAIQLLTSFVVLLLYTLFLGYNDVEQYKKTVIGKLTSVAQLLGANSASALTFLDDAAARELLTSLDTEEDIVNAWVHNADSELFATYSKSGFEGYAFPTIEVGVCKCGDGFMALSKTIDVDGQTIGRISLRLNMREFDHVVGHHILVALSVLSLGMIVALFMSLLTQKTISVPILSLVDTVRNVSNSGDYAIRARKAGNDEIGVLYDGFNDMLGQVQIREQQRDKAYESVRQSEEKYRTLFDNMNDGFAYHKIVVDDDGRPVDYVFLEVNASFEKYTGLRADDVVGKRATEAIPGVEKSDLIQTYGKVALTGENASFEVFFEPFDKWYSVSSYSPERMFFCVMFKDITVQKHAEGSLRESEEKFRTLTENVNVGIYRNTPGPQGLMIEVNPAIVKMFGYQSRDEFLAVKVVDLYHDPQSRRAYEEKMQRDGHVENQELHLRRKDGTTIVGNVTAVVVRDESGKVSHYDGIIEDITARKRTEELTELQQQQLVQADKMATLGILVSGVAHEINNPNNFMLLNSNNLADVWKDLKPVLNQRLESEGNFTVAGMPYTDIRDEVGALIAGISEGAERIRRIVQSLKDFARQDSGGMDEPVKINSVIESSTLILSNLIRKSTDNFVLQCDESLPNVKGNAQKLEQVIINLVSNACQSLPDRSKGITVSTSYREKSQEVVVVVADSGDGIGAEDLKHIMDPFFTTKRDTGGTGLGLSISFNIIKEHGGDLRMESETEKGTTATITLPVDGRK